ncbi:hypothetical protein JBE04_02280 [Streptomyces sp. PRKS01-29]|nr:hypothetical protein [Streptomyces sabulosicollis]MBI0293351.1 hypothetical protein [Streptomyces sabulosicollis]
MAVLPDEQQASRTAPDIDPHLAATLIVRDGGHVIAQQIAMSDSHDDAAVPRNSPAATGTTSTTALTKAQAADQRQPQR